MTAEWYWRKDGSEWGPVEAEELKLLADSGQLTPNDLVRKGGQERPWVQAGAVKGLFLSPKKQVVGSPLSSDDEFFDRLAEEVADSSHADLAADAQAGSIAVADDAASLEQVLQVLVQCRTAIKHIAQSLEQRPMVRDFTIGDWLVILFKASVAYALIGLGVGVVAGIVLIVTGLVR